jgi:hypothetical protein
MFDYQKALDTIEELSEMACENECSEEFKDDFLFDFMQYISINKEKSTIKGFISFLYDDIKVGYDNFDEDLKKTKINIINGNTNDDCGFHSKYNKGL